MTTLKTTLSIIAIAAAAPVFAGPVNVNTATVSELDAELAGVGPVVAQRIVDFREQHGRFASAEMLAEVKGIGAKTLDKNREFILLD